MITKALIPVFKKILVFLSIFFLFGSLYANTAHNENEVAVITKYEVQKGYRKKIEKILRSYVTHAIHNKSNLMAEAFYEEGNPDVLWLIERWESKSEMEKTRLLQLPTEQYLLQPARSIYVKDLEPLSKNEWQRTPEKKDKPVLIMLFIDCKPGTEARFKEVYHKAMPEFRGEPGVINYQLSQLEEDSTQFVTYEKFRNEAGFQYHLSFPPIQPVINYLNSSIKKQPFQSGLHRLIELAPKKRK